MKLSLSWGFYSDSEIFMQSALAKLFPVAKKIKQDMVDEKFHENNIDTFKTIQR